MLFAWVIPIRSSSKIPEFLEVHEVPSEDVRMVPDSPTTTKLLFAKVTPRKYCEVPDVLEVHEVPSEEVRMVPNQPTATNVLPPKVTPPRYCEVPELLENLEDLVKNRLLISSGNQYLLIAMFFSSFFLKFS